MRLSIVKQLYEQVRSRPIGVLVPTLVIDDVNYQNACDKMNELLAAIKAARKKD